MSLSAIITEVWPRGSGPQRHNLLVVVGVVLAGEGDLHARAAERAVADDDFAVVLLDDLRRHRQTQALAGRRVSTRWPRWKISWRLLSGIPGRRRR